ncbi:septin-5 isoform X3 [Neofelis nebulosa]|uniref:septin-5 isoform X3 n=1 Tax=Neofelis nebulosa TaxID=61452 RepID=UPI00272D1D6E|nr:septin-5 isoform X3 [Neofelis nebulosa]
MLGLSLRSSFPVAPPAAQFPSDCFPATVRVGRSCSPPAPPASAREAPPLVRCGSRGCLWLRPRAAGAGPHWQRHGTRGLWGQQHRGCATSLLWASIPASVKRGRERSFRAVLPDIDKQYVGFATLPNQVHRKSVKKGFDFTLMVAGESGLGKSTLVHSLFLTDLYKDRKLLSAEERISQTVEILKHTVDIEEKGVKLKLTIVDTPGFGDAVNNSECWKPITDYVDQQFEQYFRDESGLNRKNIQDNRVHCCLYFISPFGHGLRPVDVGFMKALHEKVNIVPLIAKADCLVPSEIRKLKERIREEIDKFGIHVYQFPECDSDEDEDFKQQDRELKESAPFAVIGSNTVVEAKGQRVRGRLYPWGIVEVENQAHCDFVKLRNMLIRTHMHDLKDVTCDVHYENYRAHCIQQMTSKLTQDSRMESPIPILPLPTPDAETEKLIRMKDEELRRMQEMLQKMKQQMQDQ